MILGVPQLGLAAIAFVSHTERTAVNSVSSATFSVTVPSGTDNAAIIDCAMGRSDTGINIGAGQTQRSDRIVGTVNDGVWGRRFRLKLPPVLDDGLDSSRQL